MIEAADLTDVARTIQTALAPVFLLTGISGMLNVMSGRLARVIDRARRLENLHGDSEGDEHIRHVQELRILDRRISLVSDAIFLFVASAIATSLVVAMLFVAGLTGTHLANFISVMFIVAMLLLMLGLVLFSIEVRVATRSIHVRKELLEHDAVQIKNGGA